MPITPLHWRSTRFDIDCSQVRVMAIVNVTPDSFSDGGQAFSPRAALQGCEQALREGADMLDIGAESTRPDAASVPADEERRRLMSVLEPALRLGVPVSVDTRKASVMQWVLDAGADIINDVSGAADPATLATLARFPNAGLCLMHMRGEPDTMSALTQYDDVVTEVCQFLAARLQAAQGAGIVRQRIALDPGYGFAKKPAQSWQLLARQHELTALGQPLVVGLSRKGMLGEATGRAVGDRQAASVAAAVLAAERGAQVLRVHDVAPTVDALAVWRRVAAASSPRA